MSGVESMPRRSDPFSSRKATDFARARVLSRLEILSYAPIALEAPRRAPEGRGNSKQFLAFLCGSSPDPSAERRKRKKRNCFGCSAAKKLCKSMGAFDSVHV